MIGVRLRLASRAPTGHYASPAKTASRLCQLRSPVSTDIADTSCRPDLPCCASSPSGGTRTDQRPGAGDRAERQICAVDSKPLVPRTVAGRPSSGPRSAAIASSTLGYTKRTTAAHHSESSHGSTSGSFWRTVRQARSPRHRLTVIAADGRILTMSSSHAPRERGQQHERDCLVRAWGGGTVEAATRVESTRDSRHSVGVEHAPCSRSPSDLRIQREFVLHMEHCVMGQRGTRTR
jgi:hypothetical protein